ncbi:TonB-dependent receptor [Kordiimonas gwangyangensis]|uniref:TonB-dependent receptor n=1 Tax=Kordiimonas gwangyangensis TaxID=288022 RepID=UPI00037600BE|nr:TonB-dependent receptor [Kordiimonas gwangyangensis]
MSDRTKKALIGMLMASSAMAYMVPTAYAQEAGESADAEDDLQLEEIYVTARKKRELVVEVPMNISTVGSVEIEKRNLVNKEDMYRTIAGAASPRGSLILRGLSGSNSTAPGTTTTWTDGIPYNFSNLFDVERVEVLRGPQGTLWGSNAIGGTVQVITKKPNLDEFEGLATLQFDKEKNRPGTGVRASAAVNFPIIAGELALRVTGSVGNVDKKVLNTYTGVVGKDEDHFIRTQLMWSPSPDTRVTFMHVNERIYTSGFDDVDANSPTYYYDAILTANPDAPYGYDVALDFPSCPEGTSRTECFGGQLNGHDPLFTQYMLMDDFTRDRQNLFALNIEKDDIFPGADLTYSGSYRRNDNLGRQGWWSRADANDMFRTWIIDKSEGRRWTHEVRLQSNKEDAAFDWTVGAFYDENETLPSGDVQWQYHASDDRSRAIAAYLWGSYWGLGDPSEIGQTLYGDDTKNYNYTIYKWKKKELAFFGELSYTFDLGDAGSVELTGGLRYYDLKDDLHDEVSGIWIDPYELTTSETITNDGENGTRKKFSINYMPNETLGIFAIYSEGYRRGGNNGPNPPADCLNDENIGSYTDRYASDQIKNYEVGVKGAVFDRRMSFSSAVYQIDWSGVQADVYMPSCGFSYTANAASARSRGVEFESTTQLMDGLSLQVNAAYTNSKMTSDVPALGAEDGDDMTMVPKYNFYVALDKEFEIWSKEASVRLEMLGYGEYKSHFNVREDDISPAYEVVNLNASFGVTDNARLSIFVNNLLDKEIITYKRSRSRSDWSGNALWYTYGQERNVTIRLDVTF